MRDQEDDKKTGQTTKKQQPDRPSQESKQRQDTPNGGDADEPQICRGID